MSNNKQTAVDYGFSNYGKVQIDFLEGKMTQFEIAVKQTQIVERSRQKFKEQSWEFFQAGQNSMEEGGKSFEQYWQENYGGNNE